MTAKIVFFPQPEGKHEPVQPPAKQEARNIVRLWKSLEAAIRAEDRQDVIAVVREAESLPKGHSGVPGGPEVLWTCATHTKIVLRRLESGEEYWRKGMAVQAEWVRNYRLKFEQFMRGGDVIVAHLASGGAQ